MIRKFKFDYDYENDNLFMYDPDSKSRASVEMDDLIIDYNSKKEISAVELLNACEFFNNVGTSDMKIDKELLNEIIECNIDLTPKNNFFLMKFIMKFKSKKQLSTPIIIPTIHEHSPAAMKA